jgi:hypothetical protein
VYSRTASQPERAAANLSAGRRVYLSAPGSGHLPCSLDSVIVRPRQVGDWHIITDRRTGQQLIAANYQDAVFARDALLRGRPRAGEVACEFCYRFPAIQVAGLTVCRSCWLEIGAVFPARPLWRTVTAWAARKALALLRVGADALSALCRP